MKKLLGVTITMGKRKAEAPRSASRRTSVSAMIGLCIATSGCKSKQANAVENEAGEVKSSDIVGSWKLTDMGGVKHPMVGGTIELSSSGEIISYLASGKKGGGGESFWYLLRLESGETIIATDTRFGEWDPITDELELPMAVVLEGDTMKWNLLEREPGHRAKPSEKTAYRFTRNSPK